MYRYLVYTFLLKLRYNRIYYGISFKDSIDNYIIKKLDYQDYELFGNIVKPLVSVSENKVEPSHGLSFVKPLARGFQKPRVLITKPDNIHESYPSFKVSFDKEDKKFNTFIGSYKINDKLVSLYYTSDTSLSAQSISVETKKQKVHSEDIIYSNFFLNINFSQIIYPTLIGRKKLKLAIYTDSSYIYANKVHFWVFDEEKDKILQPIKYNLKISENCFTLGLTPYGEGFDSKVSFYCKENNKWYLYFLGFD